MKNLHRILFWRCELNHGEVSSSLREIATLTRFFKRGIWIWLTVCNPASYGFHSHMTTERAICEERFQSGWSSYPTECRLHVTPTFFFPTLKLKNDIQYNYIYIYIFLSQTNFFTANGNGLSLGACSRFSRLFHCCTSSTARSLLIPKMCEWMWVRLSW